MPAGRPTKYRPEYCQQIIDHMAQGLSKEAFAGAIGVHKETIYNWAEANPEFSDAIKNGEQVCRLFWESLGIQGATGSDAFNATAWIFNMKNRFHEEWRDRHEHTGADGGALVVQVVRHGDGDE